MNLDLLKAGYVFYLTRTEKAINGVYIKGNEFRVDGIYEESIEKLKTFEMLENILKTLDRTNAFAIYYNWDSQKYVGEVRVEKYFGPYNEEKYYEVTHKVTDESLIGVLLNIDSILEEKDEKSNKIKQLNNLIETLDTEDIEILIEHASKLRENTSSFSNKINRRILKSKK